MIYEHEYSHFNLKLAFQGFSNCAWQTLQFLIVNFKRIKHEPLMNMNPLILSLKLYSI